MPMLAGISVAGQPVSLPACVLLLFVMHGDVVSEVGVTDLYSALA